MAGMLRALAGRSLLICICARSAVLAACDIHSAEFYPLQNFKYGRFEANTQFAVADGVISSFFLWKEFSYLPTVPWNELDFEKVGLTEGGNCNLRLNIISGDPGPVEKPSFVNDTWRDICEGFHTYTFEWTPEYIAWFFDGEMVRNETGFLPDGFAHNASEGMQFRFNVWPGDATFGGNFTQADLPVFQYLDWVRYSSWDKTAGFREEWLETFNGESAPRNWLTGDWESPHSLSKHNPANVVFSEGCAVLQLTEGPALQAWAVPRPAPRDTILITMMLLGMETQGMHWWAMRNRVQDTIRDVIVKEAGQGISGVHLKVDIRAPGGAVEVHIAPPDGVITQKLCKDLKSRERALGKEVAGNITSIWGCSSCSAAYTIGARVTCMSRW